jgi:hypothetical protein
MATERSWYCKECGKSLPAGSLFESLKSVADSSVEPCGACQGEVHLRLKFDYGLGAGGAECKVVDCFYPDEPQAWDDPSTTPAQHVTFYPFVVITVSKESGLGVWLPYWHVTKQGASEKKKYGQWAPSMDLHIFSKLVQKARERGHSI